MKKANDRTILPAASLILRPSHSAVSADAALAGDELSPRTPPDSGGRSRRRYLLARLALVAIGLSLPLLTLEAALRLLGPLIPGEYQTASFIEMHPQFGRRNRPGEGWKRTEEYTNWIAVNSNGLRGPEIEYANPSGETRILALGDSFTFAEQVNQHESYVQRLEDLLNGDGGQYRVLNGGSNGWSTANQVVFLAREGVRYRPDVVLLAFYAGNDPSENFRRVGIVADAEQADLALRGADALEGFHSLLRRSLAYTTFETGVLARIPVVAEIGRTDGGVRPAPQTLQEVEDAWRITVGLIGRMQGIAHSQGAAFAVMVIPSGAEVAGVRRPRDSEDEDDRAAEPDSVAALGDSRVALAEIRKRFDGPTLDLRSSLRRASRSSQQRLYYRVNQHWTAAGHAVAARQLYNFLSRSGLLPRLPNGAHLRT